MINIVLPNGKTVDMKITEDSVSLNVERSFYMNEVDQKKYELFNGNINVC